MKYTLRQFTDKLRTLIGDGSSDISDDFMIEGFNWAVNSLPMVPKLDKLFTRHYHFNLDAKDHYKWNLNGDFRRLLNMPTLNFYSSTGGEPCKLKICPRRVADFYDHNGIIELKEAGVPCEYTIEQEDDNIFLVLDRPSDVPLIIDYIAYGIPKPVNSMDDEVEISSIAEKLILLAMRSMWYQEADDFAFSGSIEDYLDNKAIPEAIQALNKRWGNGSYAILGEM